MKKNDFITVAQLAEMLGVSRITVFNRIKKGGIPAKKIGRAYLIDINKVPFITGKELSVKEKKFIDKTIDKAIEDYGEAIRLLGQE